MGYTFNPLTFLGFSPSSSSGGGGSGTVTSITTGTGLSGGTITTTGTISLANTAVTPASYTNTNLTVDAQGRITSASNGSINHAILRIITGNDTLSATTDSKAICNQPGGGSFTLTLPAGVQGLSFIIGQSAINTATFTIATTGGNTLDANIQALFNNNQPTPVTFDSGSGIWYAI